VEQAARAIVDAGGRIIAGKSGALEVSLPEQLMPGADLLTCSMAEPELPASLMNAVQVLVAADRVVFDSPGVEVEEPARRATAGQARWRWRRCRVTPVLLMRCALRSP
jgi:hypothetical protein